MPGNPWTVACSKWGCWNFQTHLLGIKMLKWFKEICSNEAWQLLGINLMPWIKCIFEFCIAVSFPLWVQHNFFFFFPQKQSCQKRIGPKSQGNEKVSCSTWITYSEGRAHENALPFRIVPIQGPLSLPSISFSSLTQMHCCLQRVKNIFFPHFCSFPLAITICIIQLQLYFLKNPLLGKTITCPFKLKHYEPTVSNLCWLTTAYSKFIGSITNHLKSSHGAKSSSPTSPGNPFSDALFTNGKQHFISFAQIADNYHTVQNTLAPFTFPQ